MSCDSDLRGEARVHLTNANLTLSKNAKDTNGDNYIFLLYSIDNFLHHKGSVFL